MRRRAAKRAAPARWWGRVGLLVTARIGAEESPAALAPSAFTVVTADQSFVEAMAMEVPLAQRRATAQTPRRGGACGTRRGEGWRSGAAGSRCQAAGLRRAKMGYRPLHGARRQSLAPDIGPRCHPTTHRALSLKLRPLQMVGAALLRAAAGKPPKPGGGLHSEIWGPPFREL